jgi:hypothetical protein
MTDKMIGNIYINKTIYPMKSTIALLTKEVLGRANLALPFKRHGSHRRRCVEKFFYRQVFAIAVGILPSRCPATIKDSHTQTDGWDL